MTDPHPDMDVLERPLPAFDGDSGFAGDRSSPAGDWPRHQPRAPGLGAPPSYLEVGLWRDRIPAIGDRTRLKLNPALRVDGDEVVVVDPVTRIEALFAADAAMQALLARIVDEPGEIDRLPDALRERLAALGVLLDDAVVTAAQHAWASKVQHAALSFRADGYAELPGVFSPAIIAFLRQRYRRMAREASLSYGDRQCPTRWIAHNEEAALPLHAALAPLVSAIARRRVKPSYLYLGAYAEGSELPRHTDREQCEITLSLLIDYLPDPGGPSPWPLQMYLDDEPLEIHQRIGESLLFCGREIEHARPPLAAGQMSSSIFFHFVDEDFRGRLG